jgi:glucosamine--fructose-6-phosphate aminotransferase (isomerizing)
MCGIVGYVGPRQAQDVLVAGLTSLEYRGYDSAGLAIMDGGLMRVSKAQGKLSRLAALLESSPLSGNVGIGHTRWATHGAPSDANAHPHTDPSGKFVVVHNGIIENYLALREHFAERGHVFGSETDTEVLAHVIAEEYDGDLKEAVRKAMGRATGAYALVAMAADEPGRIVAARMISPLIVGLAEGETFLASDIPAILPYTDRILVIEDGEMVDVTADGATVEKIDGTVVEREPFVVDWDPGQAEKGGYDHFMLKEILEQPEVIENTISGRLDSEGHVDLEDVSWDDDFARNLDKIWITACGTAYNAGLVGRELFEKILRVPVEIAYAHELRYRDPLITGTTLTLAISQSGETADTLAAARLAKDNGSRLVALTNVVGSTLSRDADDVLYTRAGPEIAVASTKAYMAMLIGQALLAIKLGLQRGRLSHEEAVELTNELRALPAKTAQMLESTTDIAEIAKSISGVDDLYFIGRGLDYAVAMEGSLKLKEISYVHSEAMPAGELKHGTLALVTDGTPVIVVLTQQHVYDKTISGLQEVKARGANVIAVAYEDDTEAAKYADRVIRIPRTIDVLAPVLAAVPLQLLAYYVALELGHDIDQPRNLAKSVTVE